MDPAQLTCARTQRVTHPVRTPPKTPRLPIIGSVRYSSQPPVFKALTRTLLFFLPNTDMSQIPHQQRCLSPWGTAPQPITLVLPRPDATRMQYEWRLATSQGLVHVHRCAEASLETQRPLACVGTPCMTCECTWIGTHVFTWVTCGRFLDVGVKNFL